jgi:hypothetical protein
MIVQVVSSSMTSSSGGSDRARAGAGIATSFLNGQRGERARSREVFDQIPPTSLRGATGGEHYGGGRRHGRC